MEQPADHFRDALERVLEEAELIATAYTSTEERMHRQIMERRPGFNPAEAGRYADYAAAARLISAVLHKTAMQSIT